MQLRYIVEVPEGFHRAIRGRWVIRLTEVCWKCQDAITGRYAARLDDLAACRVLEVPTSSHVHHTGRYRMPGSTLMIMIEEYKIRG